MDLIKENFGLGKRNQIPLSKEEKEELRSAFQQCMYATTAEGAAAARNDKLLVATIIYLVSSKAGIGWTTGAHTGINVPVYAIGVGAGQFTGYIDNTDIPSFIEAVMPPGPAPDPQ